MNNEDVLPKTGCGIVALLYLCQIVNVKMNMYSCLTIISKSMRPPTPTKNIC